MHFLLSLALPKPQQPGVGRFLASVWACLSIQFLAMLSLNGMAYPTLRFFFFWSCTKWVQEMKKRKHKIADIHWLTAVCQKFPKLYTLTNVILVTVVKIHILAPKRWGDWISLRWSRSSKTTQQVKRRDRIVIEACVSPQSTCDPCSSWTTVLPMDWFMENKLHCRGLSQGSLLVRWHTVEVFSYTHKMDCMVLWTY